MHNLGQCPKYQKKFKNKYINYIKMKYECLVCNFSTNNKYNYCKHLKTKKHLNKNKHFICECGKSYKFNSGLSKHKNKCIIIKKLRTMKNDIIKLKENNEIIIGELIKSNNTNIDFMKNNKDLIYEVKKLKERNGKSINQNIQNIENQNITNTQNISINVFLNKHCRNAMNLNDFMEKIQITFDDLIYTGETNYVEGISRILIKNLNKINKLERPIQCSDVKRKVLYFKNEEGWEKDKEHNKINECIKDVEIKQIQKIPEWRKEENINIYKNNREGIKYQRVVFNAMGGMDLEKKEKNKKNVIKKLSEKTNYKN